jgi:hypothetical protein
MVGRAFGWLCERFADIFGSPYHFVLALLVLVWWVHFIAELGLARWTLTWGINGNTYESTAEYFLAVATLYLARKIDRRHDEQLRRIEQILHHLEETRELEART